MGRCLSYFFPKNITFVMKWWQQYLLHESVNDIKTLDTTNITLTKLKKVIASKKFLQLPIFSLQPIEIWMAYFDFTIMPVSKAF